MINTSALIQESLALEAAEKYQEAMRHISQARRGDQKNRELALRQGKLLEVTKHAAQAVGLYRQLVASQPKTQELELILGLCRALVADGQYEQAEQLFSQLGDRLADQPDLLVAKAICARERELLDEAERLIAEAQRIAPDHKPARHEQARLLIVRGKSEEAIPTLELNLARLDPHGASIDLWLDTLKQLNRDLYTQDKLRELVSTFPERVEFVFALGVVAHRNGEIAVARPALERSMELSPSNYRILHELGVMERIAGNTERSQQLIEESLTLKPDQPAALRTYGTDHKYIYGDSAFVRLNYAAAQLSEAHTAEKIQLHYALGKAFDDVGELKTAFSHYRHAGHNKKALEPFSEEGGMRMADLIKEHVTAKNFDATGQHGCLSDVPVFILGMPRSGTSLMEQILSSHPDIYGAGELKYLTGVLDNILFGSNRLRLLESEAVFPYELNASWADRGQRYVERVEALAAEPKRRIVDKMPGNFILVGLIHAILPNARIIHSMRHPVETCLSCYRINFSEGQQWSYDLSELGRQYKRYWSLMDHWRREFPGLMLDVRYEDNVADVESQARKLIDFLGLDWHQGCLEFYNTERAVLTASSTQVKRPIYTTSTNRWRKYQDYLGPLIEELGDILPAYEAQIAHLAPAS